MISVIKLGGSLMKKAADITDHLADEFSDEKILIVPGGGMFADSIRSVSRQYSIDRESSHWMAILAMEQYAYYLIDKTDINYTESLHNISEGVSVLLPYLAVRKLEQNEQKPELPHTWDVTSDSITAWFSYILGCREFIKATSVDGIYVRDRPVPEITAPYLKSLESSCTDNYLPTFLEKTGISCIVVNGNHPERISGAIKGIDVEGTVIRARI